MATGFSQQSIYGRSHEFKAGVEIIAIGITEVIDEPEFIERHRGFDKVAPELIANLVVDGAKDVIPTGVRHGVKDSTSCVAELS